jgi:hypothetical protein
MRQPASTVAQAKDGSGNWKQSPGHLEAWAGTLPIHITAPTLGDQQQEAHEALIEQVGQLRFTAAMGQASAAHQRSMRIHSHHSRATGNMARRRTSRL